MNELATLLDEVFGAETLISATLSEIRLKDSDGFHKVTLRPIVLRRKKLYQFEYRYAQKVKHENLSAAEAKARIGALLTDTFKQGYFYAGSGDFQVAVSTSGKVTVRTKSASKTPEPASHDRSKNYLLAEGAPIDFLVRLGVMNAEGKVIAAKRDKFKQINRFLEMVDDTADSLPQDGLLHIIDFGCGKAYLTFALYYYLTQTKGREVSLVGLDLKQDVVDFCGKVAEDLHYSGLTFAVGEIGAYERTEPVHMVVTLHACDTATDDALVKAVAWNAQVILSVPCCQHELFPQLSADVLKPMLKYGILKERLTALLTDSVRASLLESAGYTVQILEFISLEHTAKNLLIRAVKRSGSAGRKPPSEEYAAFRDFWHIHPYMETALRRLGEQTGEEAAS